MGRWWARRTQHRQNTAMLPALLLGDKVRGGGQGARGPKHTELQPGAPGESRGGNERVEAKPLHLGSPRPHGSPAEAPFALPYTPLLPGNSLPITDGVSVAMWVPEPDLASARAAVGGTRLPGRPARCSRGCVSGRCCERY